MCVILDNPCHSDAARCRIRWNFPSGEFIEMKDRLGHDIAHGDMVTAEGEAHLQGTLGTIPLNIWLINR